MKNFLLVVCIVFCGIGRVSAQSSDLMVQGTTGNLHLSHTVQPKETWYSIGRIYNISPKEIAPFNGLTIDKPLAIGQQVKIPLAAANFTQDASKAADEVFVPLYHVVQDKEWMYRISVNYNKVPIETLEKWNGVSKDQVKAGMKLVVGYLKVKSAQSALASKGSSKINTQPASNPAPQTEVARSEPPRHEPVRTESAKTEPVRSPQTEVAKADPPKADPAKTDAGKTTPVKTQTAEPVVTKQPAGDGKGSGYFKDQFDDNGKTVSGAAGVFKSTSGWNDGKYYALMNNVPVGSIIKVNNTAANKAVFAKVLGSLPEMKESAGLTIRVSDAAAAELGAGLGRFNVEVRY